MDTERQASNWELRPVRTAADRYDVSILGGGLAGLTLAIQLKQHRPETSVLVLEKREGPAPLAAFKVGESTVPSGAHYFADVVGMETIWRRSTSANVACGSSFPPETTATSAGGSRTARFCIHLIGTTRLIAGCSRTSSLPARVRTGSISFRAVVCAASARGGAPHRHVQPDG